MGRSAGRTGNLKEGRNPPCLWSLLASCWLVVLTLPSLHLRCVTISQLYQCVSPVLARGFQHGHQSTQKVSSRFMFPPWRQHQTEPRFWPGAGARWALGGECQGAPLLCDLFLKPCDLPPLRAPRLPLLYSCCWVQKGVCEPRVGFFIVVFLMKPAAFLRK